MKEQYAHGVSKEDAFSHNPEIPKCLLFCFRSRVVRFPGWLHGEEVSEQCYSHVESSMSSCGSTATHATR